MIGGAGSIVRDETAVRAVPFRPNFLMRIPAGIVNEKMTSVVPEPKRPTGGAFSVYEHDTWIFTVARLAQTNHPVTWPP
jgi:hypothetical protein